MSQEVAPGTCVQLQQYWRSWTPFALFLFAGVGDFRLVFVDLTLFESTTVVFREPSIIVGLEYTQAIVKEKMRPSEASMFELIGFPTYT